MRTTMKNFESLLYVMIFISSTQSVYQQVRLDERPVITTSSGIIRGFTMNSRSGREFFAFTKIPYARPPVGELRFKNAEPVEKWDGTLEANQDLPDCWQIPVFDPFRKNVTFGTEDCLYLSVYSPKISEIKKLPVMIFIHGGGWRCELPPNGPASRAKYFMDEDIVLVTIHYRLGILGFLSLEDSVLPGNIGLKDQSMAIKWVSNNIDLFGGDPNKITLFGNSVGGASTHYHLISPMSKDLVQGGISESGVGTCLWALSAPGVASHRARLVAQHLNCLAGSSDEIVKCLRTKSAEEVTNAERLFISRDFDPLIAFTPVIEKEVDDPFLPDSPYNMFVEKPWIVGLTSDEGAFKTTGYKIEPELMDSFKVDAINILPDALQITNATSNPLKVSEEVFKKYYSEVNPYNSLNEIWTDAFFTHGVDQASKLAKGPFYLYLFDHRGKTSFLDVVSKKAGIDFSDLGVCHTDELLYLFNFEDELKDPDMKTDDDIELSKMLVNIWAKFAKNNELQQNDWPQYSKEEEKYLKISKGFSVDSKLWPDRINFWRNLNVRDNMEKMNI